MFWSDAAITSPVLTPTRIARLTPCCALTSALSSVNRSSIWQAALNARSASSSRAIGTPKVAITESPMNFWTVPPQASIVEVMTEKNRCRRTRQRSGSNRSPSVVDPVMSANRTVTSLRSAVAPTPSAAPQAEQYRAPAGTAAEQRGHPPSTATIEAYTARLGMITTVAHTPYSAGVADQHYPKGIYRRARVHEAPDARKRPRTRSHGAGDRRRAARSGDAHSRQVHTRPHFPGQEHDLSRPTL